jgi:pimeloyl-ACP methyl ester carboxylesterase/predicted glycosyltransferase
VRAREPDVQAHVECDGVKIGYEVFGSGAPTLLLVPAWTIIHSRFWKLQVPYLARHFRVITFDRPGNGRSDRPLDPQAYSVAAGTAQALAVLDATGTDEAVLVSLSQGFIESLKLAADHPERVLGAIFISPSSKLDPDHQERAAAINRFLDPYPAEPQRWERLNAQYWLDHYEDFTAFFFGECFPEPHSTKQYEDCLGWAAETTPDVLLADAASAVGPEAALGWADRVSVPTLVIHGDDDRIGPPSRAQSLAEATGGERVILEGAGHIPLARDPVRVNLLIRDFVGKLAPSPAGRGPRVRWPRARHRGRRALFVSSPIGLGHARRDIAIAAELRRHHPDLEIDWLAQHPVTRMLADAGERVHPASSFLASESAHIESESGEHRLHCFQAWRRMDEILAADFMVFHDVIDDYPYDLVVGDEAWEIDYYVHENPELKRFAYCWLTDFVGWLPMPEGGAAEAALTADYNAEMIEQIARYPRVRDLALFVGNPDDIVPDRFGDGLPRIRDWVQEHYRFPGYITGFDAGAVADREQLREDLGYRHDEQVCVVTVGGSGVGAGMLRRVIDAYPQAASKVEGLRMLVVAGPRIDPATLPAPAGVEVRAYVPHLYRHLAASDLAVVQGGLTTCMELTATRRPYIYLPLRQHFEQIFHVHHRLRAHLAGRRMDFGEAEPDALAEAIAHQIARPVEYRPVERDGAERAAAAIADLL